MSKYRITLQARIFILVSMLVVLSVSVLSAFFLRTLKSRMYGQFKAESGYLVSNFAKDAVEPVLIEDVASLRKVIDKVIKNRNVVYAYIYNKKGEQLDGYANGSAITEKIEVSKLSKIEVNADFSGTTSVMDARGPVLYEGGEKIGYVRLGISLEEIKAEISQVVAKSVVFGVGFLAAGFVLTFVFSRSISNPIRNMIATISDIVKFNDITRLIRGNVNIKELDKLKDSVNEMLHQIQQRDLALTEANELLEKRVEERTAELTGEITERRQAEEEMEKLNEKLKEANQELKNFVYIASHDLREPLRKISAFGVMLQKSLKGKIVDDDAENLGFMIEGANRMTKMIEGLLAYSRVSAKAYSVEKVDLDDIVEQLRQLELSMLLEEKHTTIDVPLPLPEVEVDPVQIRQLMQNLIANGMKYQAKGNTPCITITSKPAADGMVRINITDNGIGIAPEFQQAIFIMFKRLHSRSEYEGTGIGLAVCKKIVERHGGKIGVESQFGQGSTFWFTLPLAKTAANNTELAQNNYSKEML
jgi:signal transduction histidine kinase